MVLQIIDNPDFKKFKKQSGFKNAEFRKLAGLFSRGVAARVLFDMAVDVDFDDHTCTFSYFRASVPRPFLRFVIRHVGPNADIYEIYKDGKGRVARSGLFDRAFARLESEIEALL